MSRESGLAPIALAMTLTTMGCAVHDPLGLLGGCLRSLDGPTHGKATLDVVCDLEQDASIIAMPDPPPQRDALLKLGLPPDAVVIVLGASSDPGSHWCTLEQSLATLPPDVPKSMHVPQAYNYAAGCVASEVHIHTPIIVHARRIVLSLAMDKSGEVDLIQLRPAP